MGYDVVMARVVRCVRVGCAATDVVTARVVRCVRVGCACASARRVVVWQCCLVALSLSLSLCGVWLHSSHAHHDCVTA